MELAQNPRLARVGRWTKRGVWVVATWTLGSEASRSIRLLYGTSTSPSARQFVLIALLAAAAGIVGGVLLVGRGWQGLVFASIIGTAIWSFAFVSQIPTTQAVCGADAAGGCDHVMGVWWMVTGAGAVIPVSLGLMSATLIWWVVAPQTRRTREFSNVVES